MLLSLITTIISLEAFGGSSALDIVFFSSKNVAYFTSIQDIVLLSVQYIF